jgi:putative endonuclease
VRWITKKPRDSGQDAEEYARQYLIKQGLRFLIRNFRTKAGEIDLVMMDKNSIVFVEVRLRNHSHYTAAIESIDYYKQQRLLRTAEYYLIAKFKNNPPPCRFDVIALKSKPNPTDYDVSWIKNAFGASY